MNRKQFIQFLAGGGALITSGAYAGNKIKRIFHSYGNEDGGREILGGISADRNGKGAEVPEGDLKKVAICETDIPFVRGGFSLRGKNGESLALIPAGSLVQVVFGKKPFRLYVQKNAGEEIVDSEYCVFRIAHSAMPPRSLPLWDGQNGFVMYVLPKTLRERADWWTARNNSPRADFDVSLAKFVEKATLEAKGA